MAQLVFIVVPIFIFLFNCKHIDFTSDDESDGASKKVKTGSKSAQKDNS